MFTIYLNNLKFFSFHGVHEQERILGGEFNVDVAVTFKEAKRITKLHNSIDYVKVYAVIKQQMATPVALLETLAQDLAQNIYASDKRITSISVGIKKINPPIAAFEGSVGVSYKKDF
jgi:7,8-dihydroneopterin aldolase/epimerase/oxygenase